MTSNDGRIATDEELHARASGGELDAFTTLVQRHDRALRALAYRLIGDRDAMDDVLQDAYLKAFRALPTFRGDAAVATWLHRIVYTTAIDEIRRAGRRRHVPLEDAPEPVVPGPGTAETVARRQQLAAALGTLPSDMCAVVLLIDAERMPYEEAAKVLGVPVGTVRSRTSRARARLRAVLESQREGRMDRD